MSTPQILALIAPLFLIASMLWAYQGLTARFGYPLGYLLAFGIYWLGWCILFPLLILGSPARLLGLFQPAPDLFSLSWQSHLLLWWPVVFPLFFMFIPRFSKASPAILAGSLVLGVVIGLTEEILWRGVYLTLFPASLWLGVLYPSLMFAVWHICPQSVLPNKLPGGAASFIGYALLLGLSYAFAAQLTGSIFWTTAAHSLHDSLGLGAFAYAAWLAKPKGGQVDSAQVL